MALPASPARAPLQPTRLYPTPTSSPFHRVPAKATPAAIKSASPRKVMSHPPSSVSSTPAPIRSAVPYLRLMTPSSSTIAASSSPKRGMMSSSPVTSKTLKSSDPPLRVQVAAERTVILGRHKSRMPNTSSAPTPSTVPLSATIPSHIHLLRHPDQPADIVALPRTASHASRVHAVVEYDSSADSVRIAVIGQNGVRVRSGDRRKSRRVKRGESVDVPRGEVTIDFYGCLVHLSFPSVPVRGSDAVEMGEEKMEMPPSSPPMDMQLDDGDENEMNVDVAVEPSIPAVPALEEEDDAASSGLSAAEEDKEIKEELLDGAVVPALVPVDQAAIEQIKEKSASRESSPDDLPIPEGVDLAAILASTVVFSGSSKMSLPDMVKHMLESQPSLKDLGSEPRWTRWVHAELDTNEMFGKVERHGKDASGRPLMPHYFYNPEHDPDANRAQQLSGLVRPLRAAQRAGGKAIDWRPVGGGRRRY